MWDRYPVSPFRSESDAAFKAFRRKVPPLELHSDEESGVVFSDGGLQAMLIVVSLRKLRKPPG